MTTVSSNVFKLAMDFVFRWEGGNDDDPSDHGGRTGKGVTQREWDTWCKSHNLPHGDVWLITRDQATQIYQANYWNPMERIVEPNHPILSIAMVDEAINMGVTGATKILQQTVGTPADGAWGPHSKQMYDVYLARAGEGNLFSHMMNIRELRYHELARAPGQMKFLQGWLNRCADLRATAHKIALQQQNQN